MLKLLIKKETNQILKNKYVYLSMIVCGLVISILFSMVLNNNSSTFIVAGLFWIMIFFVSSLGLYRSMEAEIKMKAYYNLLLSPIDKGYIFISKSIAFFIFLCLTEIILFPIFQLLVKVNFVYSNIFILSALTINWTISTLGVIISMMSIQTNLGETLIPMLLFPLLVPILIAASNITNYTIQGLSYQYYSFWFLICITFSVLTTLIGFWFFKGILQE